MQYHFGGYVLDAGTRQLLFEGAEVHLSPKAFDLLTTLIDNRPRVVSKAELLEQLWPSTFVEETNLAGLVAEIRRGLVDSATRPTFVRTVYRFGYRFVGEVIARETVIAPRATGSRPCLVFDNRQVALMEGANIVGRAPDAAIQCDAAGVSRHHARIVPAHGEAILEDLGSKNGTYLRDDRVTSARLLDGDEIRLGTARLTFCLEPPFAATDTVATTPTEKSTTKS
ncbi:MAG: FHA domain-containing protein [Vicinamibacterales bacterium]